MLKYWLAIGLTLAVLGQPEDAHTEEPPAFVPGEVWVKYAPGAQPEYPTATVLGFQRVALPAGEDAAAAALDLLADPIVEWAEPNYIARPQDGPTPDDPYYEFQWPLGQIHAPEAWTVSTGDAAPIAVIDTGVNPHPDLAGRLLPGWNFIDDSPDVTDDYFTGHGTAVAGIIGAATDNGLGLAGVTWQNPILPVKVCDEAGACPISAIAVGILYAVAHDAKVINISITGWEYSLLLDLAVQAAIAEGVVVVAAAGNGGAIDPIHAVVGYPAALPNVIAVGAVAEDDSWLPWSSRGPGLDLVAPGLWIPALTASGGYDVATGTSFAAPHVTGAAALLLATGASREETESALMAGADDLTQYASVGFDDLYGWGRANVAKAVDYDGDGWAGALEQYLTTDPLAACPPGDAWPPDITQSGTVNISDVLALKPVFGQPVIRYDFNWSGGAVNVGDVLALKGWIGQTC